MYITDGKTIWTISARIWDGHTESDDMTDDVISFNGYKKTTSFPLALYVDDIGAALDELDDWLNYRDFSTECMYNGARKEEIMILERGEREIYMQFVCNWFSVVDCISGDVIGTATDGRAADIIATNYLRATAGDCFIIGADGKIADGLLV